jgi:hypothetical protein
MAFTSFRKRDGQRFRKVYPRIRRTPKYFTISDKEMIIESEKVSMSNSSQGSYEFREIYDSIPTVQISAESSDDSQGIVNVFITVLTTKRVQWETSAPFTGTIHVQVIKVG